METFSVQTLYYILAGTIFIIVVLLFLLLNESKNLKIARFGLMKLRRSFNDLDEQAKLIVKTDLELNKAQEELDKRLNGLESLQSISKNISTTLDEKEIFDRLSQSFKEELPFEHKIIFLFNENNALYSRLALNFTEDVLHTITENMSKNTDLMSGLSEGRIFSSISTSKERSEVIRSLFNMNHFVICPIMLQNKIKGVIFVGNRSDALPITEGDEEIISIMANQIGQSLDNAKLFEQVFSSSQALETKVQDRTQQLERALKEVQNISKTKSEFISAVSHELRTPLTSIKGYAAILIAGKLGEVPDAVRERLAKINTHSDNLVNLINDLLDISRIESGKMEMNIKETDVTKMIENVHDLLTPQMRDRKIHWTPSIQNNLPEIQIDSSQFERVFINLVGNAVKFTPEEGSISVKAQLKEPDTIAFEVSDTGIGITEKDIAKLFDEFYRVENTINQNVKGTGLGLPLAKKIVEAHHGKLWVTSKVNEGTTFHFSIPIKQPIVEQSQTTS